MDNTEKLLRLLIDALEFDIEETPVPRSIGLKEFKLTKRKKQVKARKARPDDYPPEFELLWKAYPKRNGSNCKSKAYSAWIARLNDQEQSKDTNRHIVEGLKRYKSWCDHENNTGTSFVMQMSTFLGPSRHYLEEWALPEPKKEKLKVPFGDAMEPWAKKLGLRGPGRRESYDEYHKFLCRAVENMND